ncbi:MAG: hypothetical protein JW751_15260 [Polyangiaceae bacterium]|nr:hypothetical protein [Polyangiaceae bacterium]
MASASIRPTSFGPQSIVSVLGVTYVHRHTSDGGDMYLTEFGLPFADLLEIENWYERAWFLSHRERLEGTSAVYRVHTKEVEGRRLNLVVKNCRVGEDVPLDTKTLLEFINTEFNSPWEEFALVMELRLGKHGPSALQIHTQEPLAIYVPPQKMQLWQSGRSVDKFNRIKARHPGVEIDILRQYKLIYRWIEGEDIVKALTDHAGVDGGELAHHLGRMTKKAIADLDQKGFAVADMKPVHVIIGESDIEQLAALGREPGPRTRRRQLGHVRCLVKKGTYSVVDYELLLRTAAWEAEVKAERRHTYLDDQRARFVPTDLPNHLTMCEVFDVPYVCGHVESTGGMLWVVGRNGRLFDYFLPERWRTSQRVLLSSSNEVYYVRTKDNIHLVHKTSRVGEVPALGYGDARDDLAQERGYNSPFEAFAVAQRLSEAGVPTVFVRAIYRTGTPKVEASADSRRFETHTGILGPDGTPILQPEHNYITLRGYFNGSDSWAARGEGEMLRPIDLRAARLAGLLPHEDASRILERVRDRVREAGLDGTLLVENDLLLTIAPSHGFTVDDAGEIEARISSLELIYPQ